MGKPTQNTSLNEATAAKIRREITTGTGYGRPPVHTRFRKGQSGNPAGRPPKRATATEPSPTSRILLAEAERAVRIVENGTEREITAKEAVVKASIRSAVQGNAYAQERILTRIERAECERAAEIERQNRTMAQYIEICRAEMESARAKGQPEPVLYPHPDDIVVEPGTPFRVNGPVDEAQAAEFDTAIRLRDLLILQATMAPIPVEGQVSIELLYAHLINDALPRRMRLDDEEWLQLDGRGRRTPKRTLAKEIHSAWRDLGVDVPRGTTLPLLGAVQLRARILAIGNARRRSSS